MNYTNDKIINDYNYHINYYSFNANTYTYIRVYLSFALFKKLFLWNLQKIISKYLRKRRTESSSQRDGKR